ncbi:MAG: hypothetical protein HFG74_01370 [Hungatella sp.]|nr:hypothetical protein [Hungatella sp.]
MGLDLYIDVIFFVNFIMDLLLLILLRRILKKVILRRRLLLGAVFGGLFGCLEIFLWKIPGYMFVFISLGEAFVMVRAVFGRQEIRELVKGTGILFGLAVAAGGAMEFMLRCTAAEKLFALPLLFWVFMAAGVFFLVQGMWQFADEVGRERRNRFTLTLTDAGVSECVTGYLDTGNRLQMPETAEGVHIVAERVFKRFADSKGERAMIPYRTIGNPWGVMEGVRIERMEIAGKRGKIRIDAPWIAKAPFGLSQKEGYEVLLYGETAIREDK